MKEGLDTKRNKIQALTAKVKEDSYPTSDGISYLEAKHLLLLNYCQSLVYYLLRKAKGLSIQGHPVIRSLVEIRLFLVKIRPVDQKLQYQIQKQTNTTAQSMEKPGLIEKETCDTQKTEVLLKLCLSPDLLIDKTIHDLEGGAGVYRPPKFAPVEDKKMSRDERNALRREKEIIRKARQSNYVREIMDNLEGKPKEIKDNIRSESREMMKHIEKMEERARQEEDLFTRAPLTKDEKRTVKQMKKSQNGFLGLTESLYDEVKSLPLGDSVPEHSDISKIIAMVIGNSRSIRESIDRMEKHPVDYMLQNMILELY